jgi:hypothetical protein
VLFDHRTDPHEIDNLAENPKFTEVRQQMEARLKRWMADTSDPFETGRREPRKGMLEMDFKLQPQWSKLNL